MATDHELHSGGGRQISSNGSPMPPMRRCPFPVPPCQEQSDAPINHSGKSSARPAPKVPQAQTEKIGETARTSFDVEEIHTIAVRCTTCQTVVRFPRIQWVNAPECCPNCGARWMRQPAPENQLPQDRPAYVFQTILAFREALQALAAVESSAVFTITLEMDESRYCTKANPATAKRKGDAHA